MVKDNGTPYGWRESPPSTALHPTVCLTPGVRVKLVSLADLPGGAATGNAEEPAEEPAEELPKEPPEEPGLAWPPVSKYGAWG
mmetsp:Transcript_12115/g.32789  ORF Transcript_12115/g.32789 Transcript_12115/m.32789 type:complete len:83 (+) Transcript_12115:476-724(+)